MTILQLIVLHVFLVSFVQSSPYRSSAEESSLCNLLSKETCLNPAVIKKCPSKCDAGLHQLFYDEAKTAEDDTKDPDECKYVPVKDCNGRYYQRIQKLCPKLCAVQDTIGDIRDHDTCKYIAPIDCIGSKADLYKKICPILCDTRVATLVSSVRESLNENEDPDESKDSSAEGELLITVNEAVKGAIEHELSAGTLDEGELVVSVVAAVKEAIKENYEAPVKAVDSPACEYMAEKLCVGEQAEHMKKLCPTLCTTEDLEDEDESDELIENVVSAVQKEIHGQVDALDEGMILESVISAVKETLNENEEFNVEAVDNPACVVMSEEECDGEQAEAIKTLCPAMCTSYETEKKVTTAPIEEEKIVTTVPIEEVTDYPSCVHLMMHDCWGNNAEVVQLNCPVLCAQVTDNSKKTRGRYRPPSWAWVSDEGIKNLITITATEGGEQAAAAGVVLDEAVTTFLEKKQDDSSCVDIGVASCTYTRIKNICPVKCSSVMSIDCEVIKSCDGVLVQMLCPQKCGAEGESSMLKSRERRGFGSRRRGGFRSRNRSPSRSSHRPPPRVSRPHSPPRPAPPAVPHGSAAQPPTVVVSPKGPGLLAQAAATAGGVAIGSAAGHVIGDAISNAIYGGDASSSSNSVDNSNTAVSSTVAPVVAASTTPPAPSEVAPAADEQAITDKPDPCAEESKVFLKCIEIMPDCSSCDVFKDETEVFLKCIEIMPDCSSCDVFKESLKQCNDILQSFDNATEVDKVSSS